mmetsp:Transcript_14907/g.36609  ORF Transcript_14907/g.36609 Transcript_14907/m.36609 type:complete len:245 (+) Transcript_14907:6053-6787(+)
MCGILCSGIPMAIWSCRAGRFTPVMVSVTGCSTCRRGLTSRNEYTPVVMLYRYSTVPTPLYPTFLASRTAPRSSSSHTSRGATVTGPSSMIFWWRRWTLQSRPYSEIACPCLSATICTSRWRLLTESCWTKMGEPGTSACTCTKPVRISAMLVTMRIPFPPPPSEAFTISGNPTLAADTSASSKVRRVACVRTSSGMVVPVTVRPEPDHGMTLTSQDCARRLAQILSPTASMASAEGPRKAMSW